MGLITKRDLEEMPRTPRVLLVGEMGNEVVFSGFQVVLESVRSFQLGFCRVRYGVSYVLFQWALLLAASLRSIDLSMARGSH